MKVNPMMQKMLQAMIGGQQNPQQFAMDLLEQAAPNNPIANNLLNMVKQNNIQGVIDTAQNITQNQGVNLNDALKSFRQQYRI